MTIGMDRAIFTKAMAKFDTTPHRTLGQKMMADIARTGVKGTPAPLPPPPCAPVAVEPVVRSRKDRHRRLAEKLGKPRK